MGDDPVAAEFVRSVADGNEAVPTVMAVDIVGEPDTAPVIVAAALTLSRPWFGMGPPAGPATR